MSIYNIKNDITKIAQYTNLICIIYTYNYITVRIESINSTQVLQYINYNINC